MKTFLVVVLQNNHPIGFITAKTKWQAEEKLKRSTEYDFQNLRVEEIEKLVLKNPLK